MPHPPAEANPHAEVANQGRTHLIIPSILILGCVVLLVRLYFATVIFPGYAWAYTTHTEIINHTAYSPYRYRLLMTAVFEILLRAQGALSIDGFIRAYCLTIGVALTFSLSALWLMARQVTQSRAAAHLSVLLSSLVMTVGFRDHYYQPWSWAELGFFALGILMSLRPSTLPLMALMALATLNRETAILLAGLHLLIAWNTAPASAVVKRTLLMSATWAVVYGLLRLLLGEGETENSLRKIAALNMEWADEGLATVAMMFVMPAVLMGCAKNVPLVLRRAVWITLPMSVLFLVWGFWTEVRVLTPLLAIFAPWAALALLQERR